jgi:hypothetical protein
MKLLREQPMLDDIDVIAW